MTVYTYMRESFARLAITHSRLKVSLFKGLNDPFELFAHELTDKRARRRFRDRVRRVGERLGVLCFSRTWREPLMWSHYADGHRGMCLAFTVDDNLLSTVDYVAGRIPAQVPTSTSTTVDDLAEAMFTTKYRGWAYEQEERVVVALGEAVCDDGAYFRPFGQGIQLREVIVGPRCPVGKQHIQDQLDAGNHEILAIRKARLAFKTFTVVENQKGFTYAENRGWTDPVTTCP